MVAQIALGIYRVHLIYNRTFARSRTPKCAKLVLGASAVHVRSRLCSRFFWRRPPQNENKAILCEKGAYCELVSSLSPHPLKEGVPTALQDANRELLCAYIRSAMSMGGAGFGETRSYAQVCRGIVLWWGVPRCRLHSGGRVRCREALRLGVAHAEGCPLVLPGGRHGERHGDPCGKCWRAGSWHWFGGACRRLAASQCGASFLSKMAARQTGGFIQRACASTSPRSSLWYSGCVRSTGRWHIEVRIKSNIDLAV